MKKIILSVLVAFISLNGLNQIGFNLVPSLPSLSSFDGDGMYTVSNSSSDIADIDNDGDLDILITGSYISKLYTNDGNGVYTEVITPFEGVQYSSVAFADIDNDGDQDVLITGRNAAGIGVANLYSNNGSGVFTLALGTPFIGVSYSSIAFADINGDNFQDVLITGVYGSNTASTKIYTNNGSGVFTQISTQLENVKIGSVAFADIDNDNDQDVLITGYNSSNITVSKLYLNNGSGIFTLTSSPFINVAYSSVNFADIDNDGDEDVLITGNSQAELYLNNGSGVFTNDNQNFDGVGGGSADFADIDGDGDLDVLIEGNGGTNRLYLNNSGTFVATSFVLNYGIQSGAVNFADVDNDNDPDVLITGSGTTALLENIGNANFITATSSNLTSAVYSSVAFSDIDNDGDNDVLITGGSVGGNYSKLYTNNGFGGYSEITTPFDDVSNSSVAFADVNGDNFQDVLITGSYISKLYTNDGTGNYTEIITPFSGVVSSSIAFADINNDGNQDVLITGDAGIVKISELFTNDGTGNFTLVIGTPFDSVANGSVAFADIDNDNDQDVLITGYNSSYIPISKLYTNDGAGVFTEITTPFDGVSYGSIAFEDIDNDGDQDVLITGQSNTMQVSKLYTNDGAGNFTEITTPFDGVKYSSVAFSDIDNDGDKDALITGQNYAGNPISKLYKTCLPTYDTITVVSCVNYTVPSGNDTYTVSGVYSDTITNFCGVDSIISINLTINPLPTVTTLDTMVCANGDDIFLDGLGLPVGGTFSGTYIGNNIFYTTLASSGITSYIYAYTDANGCTNTNTANIETFDVPSINISTLPASCGDTNGVASTNISGGVTPYQAYWNNGETSAIINNLAPGNYYYYVTDAHQCSASEVAIVNTNNITVTSNVTNNLCPGESFGAIDLTVTGSTGPYTYQWSNGDTTQNVSNLLSGQYAVFITDNDGCVAPNSITVTEPNPIEADIIKTNPTTCNATNGILDATIIGGTTPYATIEWKNSMGVVIGTTATLSNVGGGIYTLNVIDDNGCLFETTTYLNPTDAPIITLNQFTNAGCNNSGAIDVNITSQNAIQSYLWSNGATTEDITNLNAGGYSLQVNDDAGCTGYFYMDLDNELPAHTEICIVTVDTSTVTNLVVWNKPASTDIDYFVIYRETAVVGQYLPIDTVNYNDVSEYNDTTAYPQIRSWRYKITNVNFCGVESALSPPHKTIHLSINTGLGGAYNLAWDDYEGVAYSTFHIWRNTTANGWEDVTQSTNGLNTSIHTYTDTPPTTVGLDYYIEVTPDAPFSCQSTLKATGYGSTRSNRQNDESTSSVDGLTEQINIKNLSVYPNPSTGKYTISLNNSLEKNYTFSVFDIKGDLVKTFITSKSIFELDIHNLENGIYFLEIKSDDVLFKKQLIKQ